MTVCAQSLQKDRYKGTFLLRAINLGNVVTRHSWAFPYEGMLVPLEHTIVPKVFVGICLWAHHFGTDIVGLAKGRTSGP